MGRDYQGPYAPCAVAATVLRVGDMIRIHGMAGVIGVPLQFFKDMKVFLVEVRRMKTKNSFASGINWIGFFLAVFGLASDPDFSGCLAELVSQEVLSKVMAISGVLVMLIRTFLTSQGLHLPGRSKA